MELSKDQKEIINTKIGEMNSEEMQERFDYLDEKAIDLTEEEQYEYDEIEDRLGCLEEDEDEADPDN